MPKVRCSVCVLLLRFCKVGWYPLTRYLKQADVGRQLRTLVMLTDMGLCCPLVPFMEGGQQVASVTVLKSVRERERERAALEKEIVIPQGLQYVSLPVM